MASKEEQIKNSFMYLVSVVVNSLLPVITLPIFTRLLTKEDFGVFALAYVYAIFVTGISNFGLTGIYNRNFFHYKDEKKSSELLYSTLLFVSSTFLILAVGTYLFRSTLSEWIIGSREYSDLLFWAFCSSGIINLKMYYLSYFRNNENAKSFVWYTINDNVLAVTLSLSFVVGLQVGVIGLVWGPLLSSLIILSILTVKFLRFLPPSLSWSVLKFSLKLSFPMTPSIFFKVVSSQFDKYMIGLLASVGGVGIYSIAQRVAYLVFTYMTAIQNVFMPQVYKKMFSLGKKGGEAVGRYLTPFLYLSIAIALLISLFAEEAIWVLAPKPYHGAIDIVIILSMFYGSMFFGKQPQLIFAKKPFLSSLLTILGVGLNVVLNIPFIMKWGVIGAAWATLIAGLVSGGVFFVVSQHYYEIKWEYRRIVTAFLIFYASSILMILLRQFGVAYEIRLVVKCVSLAIYFNLGITLKIITMENYSLIKDMLSLKRVAISDQS